MQFILSKNEYDWSIHTFKINLFLKIQIPNVYIWSTISQKTHDGLFMWKINLQKQTRFFFEQFSKNPWYFPLNFFQKIMGFSLHIFQKPMEFFHEKNFSKSSWDFSRKNPYPRLYLIRKHLQKSMVFLYF